MNRENSPFTPGNPVPVELFVGRSEQINELLRYMRQTSKGKQENIFLTGERGIGKSSLASFLRQYAISRENMIGVHVFLGRVETLEEMVRHIFDQILKNIKNESWFSTMKDFFGNYITSLDLFGISVSFSPPREKLDVIVRNFPVSLDNLMEKIRKKKSGIFIVLDDINGLIETTQFADWYKSFVDEIATHYPHFPVFIMLLGLPEKRDLLSNRQPSLMRIFRVVDIENLSDEEVRDFFVRAFDKAGMTVEKKALDVMIRFSNGLPILMHEIGDAVFWNVKNSEVKFNEALEGIYSAATNVGKKYLDPKVYRAIRSENYRSILRKLGGLPSVFRKSDIEEKLTDKEKKVLSNFLTRIKNLGVIQGDVEKGKGVYRFVNEIYRIYISMESRIYSTGKNDSLQLLT